MLLCKKCAMLTAGVAILFGIAFLLADLGLWTFWGINWWTAVFLLFGLVFLLQSNCKSCQDLLK
jgi:hypothetical protein